MASKKHLPEEAVAKLGQVDVLVSQGQPVAEGAAAARLSESGGKRPREISQKTGDLRGMLFAEAVGGMSGAATR